MERASFEEVDILLQIRYPRGYDPAEERSKTLWSATLLDSQSLLEAQNRYHQLICALVTINKHQEAY